MATNSTSAGSYAGLQPPVTYSEANNMAYALSFFEAAGYSTAQAAGMVGNFMQESSVNPESVEPNGVGHGIAQWSAGGRWQSNLMTGNNATDLENQLNYVLEELNGSYASANTALKATTTASQAAQVFGSMYEQYGILGNRVNYANDIYSALQGDSAALQNDIGQAGATLAEIVNPGGIGALMPGPNGTEVPNPNSGYNQGSSGTGLANIIPGIGNAGTILTDLASGQFWSKILLFAGGAIVFTFSLVGFISTTSGGKEAISIAAEAVPK